MAIPASIATSTQQLPNTNSIRSYNSSNLSNHKSTNSLDPTVSWTSSIARLCRSGRLAAAAAEFTRMRIAGVEPNNVTFVTLLSGCADFPLKSVDFGASVHTFVRKLGFVTNDVKVGTAVVDMYSKCGLVDLARLCFDEMDVKNKVSWNTMIDGYMRNGELQSAVQLFDEMPNRDVISYTALINGFVRKGHIDIALEWFQEMQLSGIQPDYVAIVAILSACANLGAIGLGLWINRFLLTQHFKDNIRINNSLIDMYSRCGCIEFARQVFVNMPKRSLVSWNSIIAGFALNGNPNEALKYFNSMKNDGIEPDGVSFTGALTACSHAGLIKEALKLFDRMKNDYKITPRIEHYGCIVDLYSRAGRLDEALNVVQNMPMKPNEVVVGSLLAACRTHSDVSLAERLMNYIAKLDPGGDSNYVLLSNIYAADGSWKSASKVRRKMKARGIQKKPGVSLIEIDCTVHEFVAGDKSHVHAEGIYAMLESLSLELGISGYIPESNVRDINEYD